MSHADSAESTIESHPDGIGRVDHWAERACRVGRTPPPGPQRAVEHVVLVDVEVSTTASTRSDQNPAPVVDLMAALAARVNKTKTKQPAKAA